MVIIDLNEPDAQEKILNNLKKSKERDKQREEERQRDIKQVIAAYLKTARAKGMSITEVMEKLKAIPNEFN